LDLHKRLTKFLLHDTIVLQCNTINFTPMRQVLNLSLPPLMVKTVKNAVKTGSYSSTSEFFRELLRDWQENQLLKELNKSRLEIAAGKGKVLKSLKNLR